MSEPESIVILKPFRATVSIAEAADANGWRHAQTIEPAEKRLYEEICEVPGTDTVARAIDDHFVHVVFAAVTSANRDVVASILRSFVDSLTEDELRKRP